MLALVTSRLVGGLLGSSKHFLQLLDDADILFCFLEELVRYFMSCSPVATLVTRVTAASCQLALPAFKDTQGEVTAGWTKRKF